MRGEGRGGGERERNAGDTGRPADPIEDLTENRRADDAAGEVTGEIAGTLSARRSGLSAMTAPISYGSGTIRSLHLCRWRCRGKKGPPGGVSSGEQLLVSVRLFYGHTKAARELSRAARAMNCRGWGHVRFRSSIV
jgi:hypothetical protein